ncbi:MAG: phosphatase PAP2 family protein [Ignavibacteriaceae bacterium]|nr:phosphatase PAP2 family protein [Ignavibacteriaceae bacterium]
MKITYTILFILIFGEFSVCQSLNEASRNKDTVSAPTWYEMFTNIPGDCVQFYNTNFITEKIPLYAGVSVLTAGLIATDNRTWMAANKIYKESGPVKRWSDILEELGDGRTQFGLSGVYAIYGFIFNDNRALRTASEITEAVLASGAVVQVLKHITGRQSPFVSTMPGGRWDFFPNQINYHKHVPSYDAFPSGHVTTALATVVVIGENYPNIKWIEPLGYTLTGLLAISMVNTGIHWYSDYPLAVVLGYSFGMIAVHPEGWTDFIFGNAVKNVHIYPSMVNNGFGLGLNYLLD